MNTQHDQRIKRCPLLGHTISFSYCRTTDGNTPCRKIRDCWFEIFDIELFLQETLPEEAQNTLNQPIPDRRVTLFELIRKASQYKK